MNIYHSLIYCFFTIATIYIILKLEYNYFDRYSDNDEETYNIRILRISVLCGIAIWTIIIFILFKAHSSQNIETITNPIILTDNFN